MRWAATLAIVFVLLYLRIMRCGIDWPRVRHRIRSIAGAAVALLFDASITGG